jgi:CRISPR-associated protein Cas2
MNLDAVHRYLIFYHVADDPRRERLATVLQSYGDRVQYSVLLVDAKPAKLVRLRAEMHRTINTETDSILICSLGPLADGGVRRIEVVGRERPLTGHGPLVV